MKPVLHLVLHDDENEYVVYDRYVYPHTGKVCDILLEPLYVTEITEDCVFFHYEWPETMDVQLRPGETVKFKAEIPGLIADGSGWQYETLHITFVPDNETEGLSVVPWEGCR